MHVCLVVMLKSENTSVKFGVIDYRRVFCLDSPPHTEHNYFKFFCPEIVFNCVTYHLLYVRATSLWRVYRVGVFFPMNIIWWHMTSTDYRKADNFLKNLTHLLSFMATAVSFTPLMSLTVNMITERYPKQPPLDYFHLQLVFLCFCRWLHYTVMKIKLIHSTAMVFWWSVRHFVWTEVSYLTQNKN